MNDLVAVLLARLSAALDALERRPEPIPVRRDDRRGPRHQGRRH